MECVSSARCYWPAETISTKRFNSPMNRHHLPWSTQYEIVVRLLKWNLKSERWFWFCAGISLWYLTLVKTFKNCKIVIHPQKGFIQFIDKLFSIFFAGKMGEVIFYLSCISIFLFCILLSLDWDLVVDLNQEKMMTR